jgi:hypothetical protein
MPLMRNWTEIVVDETLLIPVLRELLQMAVDPNHVEVVGGANGRVILVETNLAEYWYQHHLDAEKEKGAGDSPQSSPGEPEVATGVQVNVAKPEVVAAATASAPIAVTATATASVIPSAPKTTAPVVASTSNTAPDTKGSTTAPAKQQSPVKTKIASTPSASPDGEDS